MRGSRYRFVLVEEPDNTLPVRFHRPRSLPPLWVRRTDPLEALLDAFFRLDRRGEGNQAWAPVLSDNPLTFLLDAVGDAVLVRDDEGHLVHANPAARAMARRMTVPLQEPHAALEEVQIDHRRYERRCMTFGRAPHTLLVEVLRRLE